MKETGLSRTTVLKDLLNGETLAQIDGSKTQAVESAVMAKITTRLNKAVTNGKISKTQEITLSSAATAGISKLMNLNLSTDIRVRFGGLATTPSPRCRHWIERSALIRLAVRQSTRPPRVDCLDAQEVHSR